jgi:cytochrome c
MRLLALAVLALIAAGAACGAPPPADLPRGEILYRQCMACHALEPGGNTPAGPTLAGIVGRRVAGEPDFNYSPALRRLAAEQPQWTPDLLDRFLRDPESIAPGNEMGFAGFESQRDRATLIAWLARTSDRRR